MFKVTEEHIPCVLVRKTCPIIWGNSDDGVIHKAKLFLGEELYLDKEKP